MGGERDSVSPEEAFSLLGEETRLAILKAVWETENGVAPFAEIRDRVGNPDSGQFNYHLNKLKGYFLRSVEGGYELDQAGREVVRAVMAGSLTENPETGGTPIDGTCVHCGEGLVVRYDQYGVVECGSCEETIMWNEFPPAGLQERDPDEFARAFDRWTKRRFQLAMDGICPSCAVEMETEVARPTRNSDRTVASLHACPNCEYEARVPIFAHVLNHPAVMALYYAQGVNLNELPYWEWRDLAKEFSVETESGIPWRVVVTVRYEGEELELTLDDSFDVTDVSPT